MKLENARVLLVGAAGGIGRHLARELLKAGARPCLIALREQELESLRDFLGDSASQACYLAADVTDPDARQACIEMAQKQLGGVDILINLAGINAFACYEEQSPEAIERIMMVNSIAPMLITHALLPQMLKRRKGQIVNIGSTFGSIGFSCFTAYSTSKFALRGFSQALRRELADTGIEVTYIAPRGVDTPLNPPQVHAMAKEVKMAFDKPEVVASEILEAIRKGSKEKYIGFPESLFARINGIFPGVVDSSLRKQNPVMRKYATTGGMD